ncbi:MAG: hypothetical protein ABR525_02385 [Candidatus Limnocylindria bacterium]
MEEKKAPFANEENADTMTTSIPTRQGEEDVAPMPDPAPGPEVDDIERSQIPTKVDDSGTTRREG